MIEEISADDTQISLVRGSLSIFATRASLIVVGLITTIILARVLGPAGKGKWTLISLVPSFLVTVGHLGIGQAIVYFIGKKKWAISEIAGNVLLGTLAISVALVSGFLVFRKIIFSSFLKGVNPYLVLLSLISIPMWLLIIYYGSLLLAKNQIARFNLIDAFLHVSFLPFFLISLLILSNHLLGVLISWLLALILTTLLAIIFVLKLTPINLRFNFPLVKDHLGFGIKAYLAGVMQFFNFRLDMFLVNFFLNPMNVGFYAIAVAIAEALWYIPNAISTVLFPKVSALDKASADALTPRVCRHTFFLVVVGSLLLFLSGRWIIDFIFGQRFLPALKPLWLLLPGIVTLSIAKILSSDLIGRGKPEINTYGAGLSLIVTIGLDLLLIPRWGISGAALASSIAYTVYAVVLLFAFTRLSKNSIKESIIIKFSDFAIYPEVASKILKRR